MPGRSYSGPLPPLTAEEGALAVRLRAHVRVLARAQHGYPAVMVTDTAFYRYPHYHLPSDTPEKLDYERMARVTLGLAAMLKDLDENR